MLTLISSQPSHVFPCPSLRIRSEAIIRNAADDVVRSRTVPRHQQAIDAGVALGGVNASTVLVEVQIDRDGAARTLEEIGVGADVPLRCWGGGGKEGKEGGNGDGLHDAESGNTW